jgi:hypothetical protein
MMKRGRVFSEPVASTGAHLFGKTQGDAVTRGVGGHGAVDELRQNAAADRKEGEADDEQCVSGHHRCLRISTCRRQNGQFPGASASIRKLFAGGGGGTSK